MAQTSRVTAVSLDSDLPLNPRLFCSAEGSPPRAIGPRRSVAELGGVCVDGWREAGKFLREGPSAEVPTYRQTHLGRFRLHPDQEHWRPPVTHPGAPAVGPGDLIVNKFPPIRAAWATNRLHRHPVDANCVLVKGLDQATAFWLAVCINHPWYETALLRSTDVTALPRVGLQALRGLRVPAVPLDAEFLAAQVWDHLERDLANQAHAATLMQEVNRVVADALGDVRREPAVGDSSWWCAVPPAAIEDSLVPHHTRMAVRQRELAARAGWQPLPHFLGSAVVDGRRLQHPPGDGLYLRLADVGPALTVLAPDEGAAAPLPRHVFRDPLAPEECLLSALVSQPRVAYAGVLPATRIWLTDNWFRLRFRRTPGAWALVLASQPVAAQLRTLAVGTAQQFARPAWLHRLSLPPIPLETRLRWDGLLLNCQQERAELEAQWEALWGRCHRLYVQAHGPMLAAHAQLR
jgi:hypothetical protein